MYPLKKLKIKGAIFQTECPVSTNEPINLTIPYSHPELEAKQHFFPLNNGDENLISSATGNGNEAASPNDSQIPLSRKGRDTDTAMHRLLATRDYF